MLGQQSASDLEQFISSEVVIHDFRPEESLVCSILLLTHCVYSAGWRGGAENTAEPQAV